RGESMLRRFRTLATALTLVTALPMAAAAAPPGFAFLEIPAGARISALGGAGGSFATGVEGMFWNPAALESSKGVQVAASHFQMYENLKHDDFAVGGHLWGGGLAASVRATWSSASDTAGARGPASRSARRPGWSANASPTARRRPTRSARARPGSRRRDR